MATTLLGLTTQADRIQGRPTWSTFVRVTLATIVTWGPLPDHPCAWFSAHEFFLRARGELERGGSVNTDDVDFGGGTGNEAARAFLDGVRDEVLRVRELVARIVRIRGYSIPPHDQLDVVQDALLALTITLHKQPDLVFTSGFDAFIATVAHRRCVDYRRVSRVTVELDERTASLDPSPEHVALGHERRRHYRRVLERISPACRSLLMLREHGVEYEEIARSYGRTVGALRVQLYECLKKARGVARELQQSHGPTAAAR